ncbi:Serine/threonine protein kinase ppk15 [Entamoeba marina]
MVDHVTPSAFTLVSPCVCNTLFDCQIRESIVKQLTISYLPFITTINPNLDTHHLKEKRILTDPPLFCDDERDNINNDLIVRVDDVIGSSTLDYSHCLKKNSEYRVVGLLGKGSFGSVYKCLDLSNSQPVAIKIIKNKPAYMRQGLLEIAILTLLNNIFDKKVNGNTLRLLDHFIYCSHICIVTELLGFSLYEALKQNKWKGFALDLILSISKQLLKGLEVLEKTGIVHCDVKPENILFLGTTSRIRLTDFGNSCFVGKPLYTYIQSRYYRAPEIILGVSYNTSIDMWSFGCILIELFLGIPLFPGNSEYDQLLKIIDIIGVPCKSYLNQGSKTRQFFNRLQDDYEDENSPFTYELKRKREYELDNDVKLEPSKKYHEYKTLKDLVFSVPLRMGTIVDNEASVRTALYDFISKIFVYDPQQRLSAKLALQHPFMCGKFKDIEKEMEIFNQTPIPLQEELTHKEMSGFDAATIITGSKIIAQDMVSAVFASEMYYATFMKALQHNIVLNVLSANPFSLPPITPSSFHHHKIVNNEKESVVIPRLVLDYPRKLKYQGFVSPRTDKKTTHQRSWSQSNIMIVPGENTSQRMYNSNL